jgi:hypothetical protein
MIEACGRHHNEFSPDQLAAVEPGSLEELPGGRDLSDSGHGIILQKARRTNN